MPKARRTSSRLIRYLDGLVDDLRKNLPKAMESRDAGAVHDSRVATRRIKTATDLVESEIDADCIKPFARSLRRIRRRLGQQRDVDVMNAQLARERGKSQDPQAIDWLAGRLPKISAGRKSKTEKFLGKLDQWSALRAQILKLGPKVEQMLVASARSQLDAFVKQADALVADDVDVNLDPHQVRIEGKRLRYTLEMLREQRPRRLPKRVLTLFKKLQDALGEWHDLIVLAERAMSESAGEMLALHKPRLQQRVLDLTRDELRNADRALTRFEKLWRARREGLKLAIERACEDEPAAPASEPQTDRDRPGSASSQPPENPGSIERGAA